MSNFKYSNCCQFYYIISISKDFRLLRKFRVAARNGYNSIFIIDGDADTRHGRLLQVSGVFAYITELGVPPFLSRPDTGNKLLFSSVSEMIKVLLRQNFSFLKNL
jgi:hypothetical protein